MSGYDFRSLQSAELIKLFGIEALPNDTLTVQDFLSLVPVQILDNVSSPFLATSDNPPLSMVPKSLPTIQQDLEFTILPQLNVKLPHF